MPSSDASERAAVDRPSPRCVRGRLSEVDGPRTDVVTGVQLPTEAVDTGFLRIESRKEGQLFPDGGLTVGWSGER